MKTALTIRNAEVVLPVRTERTDVSVINGRICAIGNEIPDVGEVIDADGLFLLPGVLVPLRQAELQVFWICRTIHLR